MRVRIILLCLLVSCKPSAEKMPVTIPPPVFTERTDTALHQVNGTWHRNGTVYSGYILEREGSMVISKLPIINGYMHGDAYGWYPSGGRKYMRKFYKGNREGLQIGWYENDTVSFRYHFHNDKYEGEQLTYFKSGHLWQCLHYKNGYEEGKQKTWNDSGRVINNYTVKNGKLYGVIGRYDCSTVAQH